MVAHHAPQYANAADEAIRMERRMCIPSNVEVSRANDGTACALHKTCLRRASVATIGSANSLGVRNETEGHAPTENGCQGEKNKTADGEPLSPIRLEDVADD